MPLHQHITDSNSHIYIWKYLAQEQEFIEQWAQAKPQFLAYKNTKRVEKILADYLITKYCPEHQLLYKSNGQPYLEPQNLHISISHSYPFVAIALAENNIGIDLEQPKEKMIKLQHKFCHPSDYQDITEDKIEYLAKIWCIKEALYKADERKLWSFAQHYLVLNWQQAKVFDDDTNLLYHTKIYKIEDFILALAKPV
jgi:4'-phosphopantetheinyl transferase